MDDSRERPLRRIRTGSFERRLSLTRSGLLAGTRYMARSAGALFAPRGEREARRRAALDAEARYLALELGKLKGSVVKIGQMMALYGEHFLPEEVTAALHTLEDRTVAMEWPVIRRELQRELGRTRLAELEIDPVPIAAASLGQVHLARRLADGRAICLKVQYPGVAQAIDSDIDAVATLLRLGRLAGGGGEFGEWLEEVRTMLHREVDYRLEASKTRLYHDRLRRDPRFVVPEPIEEYSGAHVLATSFEQGFGVTSADVEALVPERRNALGRAFLELFLREVFEWRELQTDPNFGNYRIRPASGRRGRDRLVLLDFGAVQEFPASFIEPFAEMIRGAWHGDIRRVMAGALALGFMQPQFPESVQRSFAEVCMGVIEPLVAGRRRGHTPAAALNAAGCYRWKESDLPTRIARRAARAAFSPHFSVPPREFVFLNRKLIGVYTFIAVLGAEFDGAELIEPYM